jgi:hypothetical protein
LGLQAEGFWAMSLEVVDWGLCWGLPWGLLERMCWRRSMRSECGHSPCLCLCSSYYGLLEA